MPLDEFLLGCERGVSTCIERDDLSVVREKNLVGVIPMFKVEGISLFKSIGKIASS